MSKKSIYQILTEHTKDGILDEQAVDKIFHPSDDTQIRISSGLAEHLKGPAEDDDETVMEIVKILTDIYNGKTDAQSAEAALKSLDFDTLELIDKVIEHISEETYNPNVYEVFKELFYQTDDIEIFKFSMEMTARMRKCKELLDDYFMAGQYEAFSIYTSYILDLWMEEDADFLDTAFRLLSVSSDWGAIDYGERLMREDWILEDIQNQKRILIGTLSNNCIPMEIAFSLALQLNIKELLKIAAAEKELSDTLLALYNTLFFQPQPCGGIFNLSDPYNDYILPYYEFLKNSSFLDITFFGLLDFISFLNDKEYREEFLHYRTEEQLLQIQNSAIRLCEEIAKTDNLKSIIQNMGPGHIAAMTEFIKEKQLTAELMQEMEQLYAKIKQNCFLEKYLSAYGSAHIKQQFYSIVKNEIEAREALNRPHVYQNIYGDEYKSSQIFEYKMDVLSDREFYDDKLLMKCLDDYNPQIRDAAIDIVKAQQNYLSNKEIVLMLIERLSDSPYYVRRDAALLLAENHIKITADQRAEIEKIIRTREPKYKKHDANFEEYETAMNIISEEPA